MAELVCFSSVYSTQDLYAPFPHQVSDATIEDVRVRLSSLDIDSSMGPDRLHPYVLKSCPNVAIPLHALFWKSVSQGKLPLHWKTSQIIPVFKNDPDIMPLTIGPSVLHLCAVKH